MAKPPPRSGQRGTASLGVLAGVGIIVLDFLHDLSMKHASEMAKGMLGQVAAESAAMAIFGRGGGLALLFFGGMRSDNAQFAAEEARREIEERGERILTDRASIYWDIHPTIGTSIRGSGWPKPDRTSSTSAGQ